MQKTAWRRSFVVNVHSMTAWGAHGAANVKRLLDCMVQSKGGQRQRLPKHDALTTSCRTVAFDLPQPHEGAPGPRKPLIFRIDGE
jgi:hypothetical protein